MQEVKVTVNGGIISDEELQEYIKRGRLQQPYNELVAITVSLDDDYVDIDYKYDNHLMPQRFSIAFRVFYKRYYLHNIVPFL